MITIQSDSSTKPGGEGRFHTTLPSESWTIAGIHDRPAHVLHVDDEPDFASLTATFLERLTDSLEVTTETSAADGLDRIDTEGIECVISDYQMPRMDGLEFLRSVREHHPDLPFILCTARGSEEVASEAIADGVTDYIQKGTDTDQYEVLANRVENAVEQYRIREQLWETLSLSRRLMDQSMVGVYIVQDRQFAYVNDYFANYFGYRQDDLVGERPSMLIEEPSSPNPSGTSLAAVPADADTATYESTGRTRSGRPVDFTVELATVDFKGESAVLGLIRDAGDGPSRGDR